MTRFEDFKSARGYYYNLEKSPYAYTSPYGDTFKLPSAARVKMMEKYVPEEMEKVERHMKRLGVADILEPEVVTLIKKAAIVAVYRRITAKG